MKKTRTAWNKGIPNTWTKGGPIHANCLECKKEFVTFKCKKCHKTKTRGEFHARAIVYGQPQHYDKSYLGGRTNVA